MTTGSYDWPQGAGSFTDLLAHRKWSGADMPKGWRRAGLKPIPHPYTLSAYRHTQSKSACYYNGRHVGDVYVYYPKFPDGTGYLPPYTPSDANLDLRCLEKLASKIREHDFNAFVFAAELPEALSLLKGSVTTLCNAALAFKRGDWASLVRNLSRTPSGRKAMLDPKTKKNYDANLTRHDLDGAWLALQYGWLPTVNDIFAAAKAVEKLVAPERSLTFRASAICSKQTDFSCTSPANGQLRCIDDWKISYTVTLVEKISTARSLGLMNPASVLWEKLPWSFVIDWAIPVGTFLDVAGFFSGLKFSSGSRSTLRRRRIKVLRQSTSANTWPIANLVIGGDFASSGAGFQRDIIGSMPVPNLPRFKSLERIFSIPHLANAAALISGKISVTRERISSQVY